MKDGSINRKKPLYKLYITDFIPGVGLANYCLRNEHSFRYGIPGEDFDYPKGERDSDARFLLVTGYNVGLGIFGLYKGLEILIGQMFK